MLLIGPSHRKWYEREQFAEGVKSFHVTVWEMTVNRIMIRKYKLTTL